MVFLKRLGILVLAGYATAGVKANVATKKAPEFQPKPIVIQSGCEESIVVKSSAFEDFEDDFPEYHIDAPEFRTAMHKAFWRGVLGQPGSANIIQDTSCFLSKDSMSVYDSATRTSYYLDTTKLEIDKLYFARTVLEFVGESIEIPNDLVGGRSIFAKPASERYIGAQISYAVYNPATRKFLYTDVSSIGRSNTFAIVTIMITKGDWYAASSQLGWHIQRGLEDAYQWQMNQPR